MIRIKDEETGDSTIQLQVPVYSQANIDDIEILVDDIDIKPDIAELLRAPSSSNEGSNCKPHDPEMDIIEPQIKQEMVAPKYQLAFCKENKDVDERIDEFNVNLKRQEELLSIASSSLGFDNDNNNNHNNNNINNDKHDNNSNNNMYFLGVPMDEIHLCDSIRKHRQSRFKNENRNIVVTGQNHSSTNIKSTGTSLPASRKLQELLSPDLQVNIKFSPFVHLCKIPSSVFDEYGHLKISLSSEIMSSTWCWYGPKDNTNNNSIIESESSDPHFTAVSAMEAVKNESGLLNEEIELSAVDQLVFGYPELENDVADSNTNQLHSSAFVTSSLRKPIKSKQQYIHKQGRIKKLQNFVCFCHNDQDQSCVGLESQDDSKEKNVHANKKAFKCDKCNKCFSSNTVLKEHMRTHTGERPLVCNECGARFAYTSSLRYHIKSHRGEKPFKCNVCGKSFSKKSHLKEHVARHGGERAFKCNECGKAFITKREVGFHMKSHVGERVRPYVCNECGKSFFKLSHLKEHIQRHSNERPYECSKCDKTYIVSQELKVHMMKKHKSIVLS